MKLAAALIYWVIVAVWLVVLATVVVFYFRRGRAFGATRMLLAVVAVDTLRIPTQSGHRFRFEAGHRSDLMSATIPK
jgi:uncharacterized RDD family membrane protein YckC